MRYFSQRKLEKEARAWVMRLTSGEATTQDADAFQAWRSRSPRHEEVFRETKKLWQILKPALQAEQHMPAATTSPNWGRRAFLCSALASASCLTLYPVIKEMGLPGFSDDYQTATGEQKHFTLGGDTAVEMNTQTRINLRRTSSDDTGIELVEGEARIRQQARQAVTVYADQGEVQISRGSMNIRYLENIVKVTCLEGALNVICRKQRHELLPGQQLAYNQSGILGMTTVNPVQVTAWQQQILIFNNTPLSEVVDEINRYRPGKIILLNQSLARRPVQARFTLNQLQDAVSLIRDTYGAKVTHFPASIVVLS